MSRELIREKIRNLERAIEALETVKEFISYRPYHEAIKALDSARDDQLLALGAYVHSESKS